MTNHVPTLETCQKLKAARFPQNGYWFWFDEFADGTNWYLTHSQFGYLKKSESELPRWTAAPILTEILEQLKPYAKKDKWDNGWHGYELTVFWDDIDGDWSLAIANSDTQRNDPTSRPNAVSDNPVEAAALLWLELHKEDDV